MIRITFLLLGITWYAGVTAAEPTAADFQFFESKVRPVLVERCFSCHSAKAKKIKGSLRLDSRAAVLKGGESGPAAVSGEVEKSLLVKAVRQRDELLHMPPSGKLADREVAVLEEWVRRGLPMPEQTANVAAEGRKIDLTEGRKFWSFQPPKETPPPRTKNATWARNRVDAFLLAEMEKQGLAPSPAASPRILVRRITFDLTGLPPTPAEVAAFEQSAIRNPQSAIAGLVERLLASPQYGERWGRFWLDLARYCDVAEPWLESKGQPWRYRDWVVNAFNEDVPYNRFVQLQLAADLLADARVEDRAALGFLGLSPSYWKELKLDKDVIKTVVAEEWEERIHTVGSTFLGLTIGCARCHDHKFDPITTQDYYALAGVFASIRQADRPLIADDVASPVRQAHERVKALQGQIEKLQAKKPVAGDTQKQIDGLKAQIDEIRKKTAHFDMPMVPGVEESSLLVLADGPYRTKLEFKAGVAQDVAVQVRGNPANPGPVVPRRFLAVLAPDTPGTFHQGSGRLELARALVTEGAPLAARVIVNRVWRHHFGTGLVSTSSDFGAQGARPTHPQLLDDLAARFMANGWSIKWLHREIVLSAAYQQVSTADRDHQTRDPDNRWLARMNRRRLEVEAWRDAMLAVAGTLNLERGGAPVDLGDAGNRRRTLYGTIRRRELNDLLRLHDFPDPTIHNPGRIPTTTPLQQLFTLNSPFVQQQAAALVRRLKNEVPAGTEARVRRGYLLLYGRAATEGQVKLAVEFLTGGKGDTVSDAAWEQYAAVLLGSNEFLFVD
jgi:hypothetical protein